MSSETISREWTDKERLAYIAEVTELLDRHLMRSDARKAPAVLTLIRFIAKMPAESLEHNRDAFTLMLESLKEDSP